MSFYTNKKMTHPLESIFGKEWAEEANRRIRLQEIEEMVNAHTLKMKLLEPLTIEEQILSRRPTGLAA